MGKEKNNEFDAYMPAANTGKKRIWRVLACLLGAILFFAAGAATLWFSLDGELRTLFKVKKMIQEKYYKDISDEDFYGVLFKSINEDLLDPYSCYMTADEFTASSGELAGNRSGLGLVFLVKDGEGKDIMKITRVCGNSPAEQAGIIAGSYLVGFGKTQESLIESEKFDAFSAFLGDFGAGEEFFLKLRVEEETEIIKISKAEYVENYVFYRTHDKAYGFEGKKATELVERGAPLTCLKEDTAYMRLIQFGGEAANAFGQVMDLFKQEGKKHLVLDLRGNGGGYLNIMQEIAGYFCKNTDENKPVVAVADYVEKKERFTAKRNVYKDYFAKDSRIFVLADEGSASASECLLGSMLDYGAITYADICLIERNGVAKTYGKGIMQSTFYLGLKGDAIKLTTAEIRWPVTNNSIHGRGILPSDVTKTVQEGITD
ncbi:MAG: hypothetical protein IKB20_01140, partial [Clostridia bacterium]|nr:hypothetical protein [Clostridia bacterium]